MSRKRKIWTTEEKAAIVLEILREESTLAEISKKYDIAQPVLSRWKADFIDNMSTVYMEEMGVVAFYLGSNLSKHAKESKVYRICREIWKLTDRIKFGPLTLRILEHQRVLSI